MPIYGKIIVKKRNGDDGSQFILKTTSCKIGRDEQCDIRIQLTTVSKEHCTISVAENGEVFLNNLTKPGSTLVNGISFSKSQPLNHLDVFTVSDRSFRWEFTPDSRYWSLVRRPIRETLTTDEKPEKIVVNGKGENGGLKSKPSKSKLLKQQTTALRLMSTRVLKRALKNKPNPDIKKMPTVNINNVIKPQFKRRHKKKRNRNKKNVESSSTTPQDEESFDLSNFKTPNIPREVFVSPLTSSDRDLGASPTMSTSPGLRLRLSEESNLSRNLSENFEETPTRISPRILAARKSTSASKLQKKTPLKSKLSSKGFKTPTSASKATPKSLTTASEMSENEKDDLSTSTGKKKASLASKLTPKIVKTPASVSKPTPKVTKQSPSSLSKKIGNLSSTIEKIKQMTPGLKLTPTIVQTPFSLSKFTPNSRKSLTPASEMKKNQKNDSSTPATQKNTPVSTLKKITSPVVEMSTTSEKSKQMTPKLKLTPNIVKTPSSMSKSTENSTKTTSPPSSPSRNTSGRFEKLTPASAKSTQASSKSRRSKSVTPTSTLTPNNFKTPSSMSKSTENSTKTTSPPPPPSRNTSGRFEKLTPASAKSTQASSKSRRSKSVTPTSTLTPNNFKTPSSVSKSTNTAKTPSTLSKSEKNSATKSTRRSPTSPKQKITTSMSNLIPNPDKTPSSLSKSMQSARKMLSTKSTPPKLDLSTTSNPKLSLTPLIVKLSPSKSPTKRLPKFDSAIPTKKLKIDNKITPNSDNLQRKNFPELLDGIKRLFQFSKRADYTNVAGMKRLMQRNNPRSPDDRHLEGVEELFSQIPPKKRRTNSFSGGKMVEEGMSEEMKRKSLSPKPKSPNLDRRMSLVPVVMDINKVSTPDSAKSQKEEIATRVTRSSRRKVEIPTSPKITRSTRKKTQEKVESPVAEKTPAVKKRLGRPPKPTVEGSVKKMADVGEETPVVRRSARNANKENKEKESEMSTVIKTPGRPKRVATSVDVEVKKTSRSKKDVPETPKSSGRPTRSSKTPAKLISPTPARRMRTLIK